MDEISMFAALRPRPPADGGAAVTRARARVTEALSDPRPQASGSRSGTRRLALAGGLAAAASAAAIVVPATLPGSAGVPRAWAVDRGSDGTVTLTIQGAFRDLTGPQKALRAQGVPAVVTLIPWKFSTVNGGLRTEQACGYYPLNLAPAAVQHAVITHPLTKGSTAPAPPGGNPLTPASPDSTANATPPKPGPTVMPSPFVWSFHPSELPPGAVVFIEASPDSPSPDIHGGRTGGVMAPPVVLRNSHLPECVPGHGESAWSSQ